MIRTALRRTTPTRPLPLKSSCFATMANIHTPIPNLKLNDGNSIPMLGFGTGTAWYKVGDGSKIDQACITACTTALKLGYTHLDGAEAYRTETELGQAIKDSGIPRSKLFLTTKVSREIQDIPSAIRASLKKLRVDHVDLYLIHMPFFSSDKAEHQKKWAQMEQVQAQGLATSIGVSNYLPEQLEWILETAKVVPALNQIEFHAYLQHPDLIKFHKERGIATAAFSPLTPVGREKGGPVDGILQALAKKYAVSPGEVCLRWCVDQDVVALTTSGKEQRLSDYLRAMTFKLTPAEIKEINEKGLTHHKRVWFTDKFDKDDRR